MSNEEKTIGIVLSYFSGRPNPIWKLKESEIEELRKKMEDLPKAKMIESPVLGYRGFRIINKDKIPGLPERIIIFNRTISLKENDEVVFYEDKNNIEEWLFKQGAKLGHEKIIERIKTHKNENK